MDSRCWSLFCIVVCMHVSHDVCARRMATSAAILAQVPCQKQILIDSQTCFGSCANNKSHPSKMGGRLSSSADAPFGLIVSGRMSSKTAHSGGPVFPVET